MLVLKSTLHTLRTIFLIITAYNLDVDIREIIVLSNFDVLEIQRDLLDRYPGLLGLRENGASALTNARQALFEAIDAYREAFSSIVAESDYQGDDLLYFGSDEASNSKEL